MASEREELMRLRELSRSERAELETLRARRDQSRPVTAGLAGASRGVLQTLDILPRGIAGGLNVALGTELDVRPFERLGGLLGLGRYQPRTRGEKAAAFTGEMIGGSLIPGGAAIGPAAVRAGRLPAKMLAGEALATTGAIAGGLGGEEVGRQIAGEPGAEIGRGLGAVAGGIATPIAAPVMAGYAGRTLSAPFGQRRIQETVEAARRQNVPISLGQAAGGSAVEKVTSVMPGGKSVADKFEEVQRQAMQTRMDELQRALTPAEAASDVAGRAISRGLEDWTDSFRKTAQQLDDSIAQFVPAQSPVRMADTADALEELVMHEEFSDILDAPLVRQLYNRIGQQTELPFDMVRALRTRVGQRLSGPELLAEAPKGQLKRLYGALSGDMERVVRDVGGDDAGRAWDRFNSYWKAGRKRLDDFLEPVARRKAPEEVYQAAMSGTKEGASRIRAIRKALSPAQWNLVSATALRRMGRMIPSGTTGTKIAEDVTEFSPETFLTNMTRLSRQARTELFKHSAHEGLENNVDDLLKVAGAIRSQHQKIYNPSGTGQLVSQAAPWIVGAVNPASLPNLATAGLLGNLAQRAQQSQAVVDYMVSPYALPANVLGQMTRGYVAGD